MQCLLGKMLDKASYELRYKLAYMRSQQDVRVEILSNRQRAEFVSLALGYFEACYNRGITTIL